MSHTWSSHEERAASDLAQVTEVTAPDSAMVSFDATMTLHGPDYMTGQKALPCTGLRLGRGMGLGLGGGLS
jgi:hypothetical protein